jgi:hypothetical protein
VIDLKRRSLITGLVGLVAAPAIVRAESLMRLARPRPEEDHWIAIEHFDQFCRTAFTWTKARIPSTEADLRDLAATAQFLRINGIRLVAG